MLYLYDYTKILNYDKMVPNPITVSFSRSSGSSFIYRVAVNENSVIANSSSDYIDFNSTSGTICCSDFKSGVNVARMIFYGGGSDGQIKKGSSITASNSGCSVTMSVSSSISTFSYPGSTSMVVTVNRSTSGEVSNVYSEWDIDFGGASDNSGYIDKYSQGNFNVNFYSSITAPWSDSVPTIRIWPVYVLATYTYYTEPKWEIHTTGYGYFYDDSGHLTGGTYNGGQYFAADRYENISNQGMSYKVIGNDWISDAYVAVDSYDSGKRSGTMSKSGSRPS